MQFQNPQSTQSKSILNTFWENLPTTTDLSQLVRTQKFEMVRGKNRPGSDVMQQVCNLQLTSSTCISAESHQVEQAKMQAKSSLKKGCDLKLLGERML